MRTKILEYPELSNKEAMDLLSDLVYYTQPQMFAPPMESLTIDALQWYLPVDNSDIDRFIERVETGPTEPLTTIIGGAYLGYREYICDLLRIVMDAHKYAPRDVFSASGIL